MASRYSLLPFAWLCASPMCSPATDHKKRRLACSHRHVLQCNILPEVSSNASILRIVHIPLLISRRLENSSLLGETYAASQVHVAMDGSAEIWSQVEDGKPAIWRVYRVISSKVLKHG